MKNLAFFLTALFLITACSSSKKISSSTGETKSSKKLAKQEDIRKAVESRKYIIKVNRIYTSHGGKMELVPRSNFVILNGEIASISLGYVGRSYTSRPISGINLNGHALNYKLDSDETKGLYKVEMEVLYGSDKFSVYLTIGNEGYCSISINNPMIETTSYSGNLVPLTNSTASTVETNNNR